MIFDGRDLDINNFMMQFGNVKNKSTHSSGTNSWKQVALCALKSFEKQLCNVA
jgi:hypothetical protein